MAPVRGRTLFFLLSFAFALAAGCSLDFTVRSQPTDGGSPPDSGPDADEPSSDSGLDAGTDSKVDATPDADAAPPDCKALADDVDAKLKAARTCVLASGHCTTTVKNQCDCDVVIASSGSGQVASYQQAVMTWKDSGCFLGCTGTCASTANKNCLQAGTDVLCYPPP